MLIGRFVPGWSRSTRPWRSANATVSSLEWVPSFDIMFCVCVRSAFGAIDSWSQIAGTSSPGRRLRVMRVALLGLGLIGGSIARALRAADGSAQVAAWTPTGRGPAAALAAGAITEAATDLGAAVRGADLVVVAAPPLATLDLIDLLAALPEGTLGSATTVTDVASTKAAVVERADAAGLRFVGGHPMAGREVTGFETSVAHLFVGRPWVVVPGRMSDGADVERVAWLARTCGALPVTMAAEAHDAAVAAVSHAPLVVSAALVEAVAGAPGSAQQLGAEDARALAASGWRGMTRLAKGDPEMGTGILATNAPAVALRLRAVRERLDAWIDALEVAGGPDVDRIQAALEADRARAVAWDPEDVA